MSDLGQREWHFYIKDMVDFARKVLTYTEGFDQAGFAASGITYDATLRNLELIGEAALISRMKSAPPMPKFLGE